MMNMPLGMITLLVVGVLIYFGFAHRVLDRMRLTDKQALWFIALVIVGSFINIPLMSQPVNLSINVGGAVLPALLSFYLIYKADESYEKIRAVVASLLTAGAVWLGSRYLPYEPENMFLDPKLLYALAAGLIAYIAGRSRRSAFVGGTLGIIMSDIIQFFTVLNMGIPGTTSIGGAGGFDVVVITGIVAVMIAEIIGETREKLQGGPDLGPNRPEGLWLTEYSKDLTHEENTQNIEPTSNIKHDELAQRRAEKRGGSDE